VADPFLDKLDFGDLGKPTANLNGGDTKVLQIPTTPLPHIVLTLRFVFWCQKN